MPTQLSSYAPLSVSTSFSGVDMDSLPIFLRQFSKEIEDQINAQPGIFAGVASGGINYSNQGKGGDIINSWDKSTGNFTVGVKQAAGSDLTYTLNSNTEDLAKNGYPAISTFSGQITAAQHGDLPGDALHAVATSSDNGFMSTTQVTALTTATSNISTINGEITTINTSITSINNSISTINGEITTINTTLTSLAGSITTINGQITTINTTLTSQAASITSINSSISTLSSDISSIDITLATYGTDISTNTSNISTLSSTSATHTSQISTINSNITSIDTDITNISNDITSINTILGDASNNPAVGETLVKRGSTGNVNAAGAYFIDNVQVVESANTPWFTSAGLSTSHKSLTITLDSDTGLVSLTEENLTSIAAYANSIVEALGQHGLFSS